MSLVVRSRTAATRSAASSGDLLDLSVRGSVPTRSISSSIRTTLSAQLSLQVGPPVGDETDERREKHSAERGVLGG